jgi:uncharacterized protein (DUF1330 family)
MSAYVIFDVDISDMAKYQEFMAGVKPALENAGAKYLVRGGKHKVHEGDWSPRRIVFREMAASAAKVLSGGGIRHRRFTASSRSL